MASRAKHQEVQDAQVPPTRQTAPTSATGAQLAAQDATIPKGKDRGSKVEIAGGAPKPDVDGPKATGAQLEPARFTSNGQIPHNHIPTASGSVPVGATTLSVDDAEDRVAAVQQAHDDFVNRRETRKRIPHETIQRLQPVELRAIAEQRGYSIPDSGGVRSIRQAFIEEQDSDSEIKDSEPASKSSTKKPSTRRSSRRR